MWFSQPTNCTYCIYVHSVCDCVCVVPEPQCVGKVHSPPCQIPTHNISSLWKRQKKQQHRSWLNLLGVSFFLMPYESPIGYFPHLSVIIASHSSHIPCSAPLFTLPAGLLILQLAGVHPKACMLLVQTWSGCESVQWDATNIYVCLHEINGRATAIAYDHTRYFSWCFQ